jgi:uncharacterized protein (TIGR02145 family)
MKQIVASVFLLFTILLSCTTRDGEIIDLINSIKKQNDDLKAQITALKKTTDSALVAVLKVNSNQLATDKKIDLIQADLKTLLTQIASLNTQMTASNADLAALKAQIEILQLKCADLVAQIAVLNALNNLYTLSVDITPNNSGKITISPSLASYKSGTEVTLSVSPSATHAFKRWSGDISSTINPLKIIMDGNKKITAEFELISTQTGNVVTDIDGNKYNTVNIGNQVWMKENLNVKKFQNGDIIPNETDGVKWAALKTGAWARYNNDTDNSNALKVGLLYNGFVAQDTRNVCPAGFRVPNDSDLQELINFLGGGVVAGAKLMEANTSSTLWTTNLYGTNVSGFTALPGGYRWDNFRNSEFGFALVEARFWTISNAIGGGVLTLQLINKTPEAIRLGVDKAYGQSIRCIKN